jgi:hypothetical protein
VLQYEISNCGMVIEIELRQFRIEAAHHFRLLLRFDKLTVPRKIEGLPAHLILSYPGRSGEVQPCLQAKAKLTQLQVIEYCTSAEQEGGRVGPVQWARRVPQKGNMSSLRRSRKNKFLSLLN